MLTVPNQWDMEVDVVAVGSSSGGLIASIVAHDLGLSTVVLEKADAVGGATALSGGTVWMPCNHHMLEMGFSDSREEALTYIRSSSKGRHDEETAAAYLDNGPKVIRYLEERTPLKLVVIPGYPDYRSDLPGGKKDGRKLTPDPIRVAQILMEAERSHPFLSKVRSEPVPLFAGLPGAWENRLYLAGRALIGSLVLACLNRGINILMNTRARQLIVQDGRVIGLRAEHEGQDFLVRGKKGVLLATGGYEWNEEMNKRFMPIPDIHPTTPPSLEGDGHIMGMELGAATAVMDYGLVLPTMRIPGEEIDGKPLYRLAILGRPGNILVNRYGKRFCNESFYPDLGRALAIYDPAGLGFTNLPMFWICDQSLRDREGVATLPKGTEMADWLHKADKVRQLAEQLGLPPDKLEETVEQFNAFAREGRDPDFHRGESYYDREWWGYKKQKPNPALGPLEKPPFYGMQIYPGTVATLGGLVTNANAQVIDVRGKVIRGLYGTSNATALLIMDTYDSGLSIGKSMVFGYIAAQHMAQNGEQLSS
ncbi:MAG: FAD-binding protein [Dehalococcoidia bacterium]|nr:FAD-binding protein [Dehalococcoidia bacterium]